MSEWKTVELGNVLTLQRGFDITKADQRPGAVPVVSSGGIGSYHDTAMAHGPGVVIGRKGTLGKVFYLPHEYWPHDTTLWVKDFKGNQPRFVYYFLQTIDFTSMNVGSSNPTLNRNHVHTVKVPWPELSTQRSISSLLGALDDKIAVNSRIAESVLELALAKYESMTSAATGWSRQPMKSVAKWLSGGTPKTSEPSYWNGNIPWISARSLKVPWIFESDRNVTSLGATSGTRMVPAGTIMFVVRGSSLDSEFRIGLTFREVTFGQDCKALLPREDIDAHTLLVALKANSPKILKLVDHAGHGAGRLPTDLIENFQVTLPTAAEAGNAAAVFKPLVEAGAQRKQENSTLSELRDTLLPKLMSGEVKIRDAEKVVEDAV